MLAFFIVFICLIILTFVASFVCFRITFYNKQSEKIRPENEMPPGKEYEPYYPLMLSWMNERKSMPFTEMSITSFDGLTLKGKYYELEKGAPIEVMFHGYKGSAERDLCGGIQRAFALKRNVLIVDQRAHGESGGNVITFGLLEAKDCLSWVEHIIKHFGEDIKIILCGISMGAATVTMAAGEKLQKNVIGILADCGYTSAKDIICEVIKKLHLPIKILYPFVRLGAIIFGGFDPNKANATESLKKCSVPIIFIHGDADNFVPSEMSQTNFDATPSKKKILIVKGAGHGAAYLKNREEYINFLKDFYDE